MNKIRHLKLFDFNFMQRYLVYLVPVIVLFNIGYSMVYENELEILKNNMESQQYEELSILSFILNTYFDQIYEDLNLVYQSNEFQNYVNEPLDEHLNEVVSMFERFMKTKGDYVQLRYINHDGAEIARVDQIEGNVMVIDELQDKSSRYYLKNAMLAHENEMYISNFDLNVERGVVVFPYQPVIRFAIPVIHDQNQRGILIINIDGKNFLRILDRYQKKDQRIVSSGILDSQNFWWFTSEGAFSEDELTLTDIKTVFGGTLVEHVANKQSGEYRYFDTNYVVTYIDEQMEADYIFESDYPFGLLSSYDQNEAVLTSKNIILTHDWIRYLVMLFIAFIIWQATLYLNNKESEQLMIFASGYISLFTYDGVVITDSTGKLIFCNSIYEKTFGYTLDTLKENYETEMILRNPDIRFKQNFGVDDFWEGHIWDISKNGTHIFKHLRVKAVRNKYRKVVYYVGIFSEPKLSERDILFEDAFWRKYQYIKSERLTTEHIFDDFYEQAPHVAVLAIKLSELSIIKQALYLEDTSIISGVVSSHIYNYLSEKSKIAFVAEDLMVVAVHLNQKEEAVEDLMKKIEAAFYALRISENSEKNVGYLVGISISPDHGDNINQLISNAFISLEALTKIKMARYLVYDSYLFDVVKREIQIHEELENAFNNKEFYLVYQIQKSMTSETIVGAEALIRWNSPKLGYLLPKEFIPIIEKTDYVSQIAKYVLHEVIKDFEAISNQLSEDFRISINLTEPEFMDLDNIRDLLKVIEESHLKNSFFCFEITESILIECLERTNEVIDLLQENEISVAIDDFGTGYSSLSYLNSLKADKLKIDRAFIKDYPDSDSGTLLKAIIRMTKALEIKTIIEGVETEEQHAFCVNNGCHEYQGYYGSKPVAMSELRKILSL